MRNPLQRWSALRFWVVTFAVLTVGIALAPCRGVAQKSAPSAARPAATGQSAASSDVQGLPAQPGNERQEEEESDNVYRHTPLVNSIAKALHMPVETTARLFEIINFAVIFLAILIPLVKILPRHLRKRRETLSQNLEEARKTTQDANARLSAVEAQLSRLDGEIARIRAQVEEESKQDEMRIKSSIEEESARIVAAVEQEIGAAAAQAKRGLRHFAADLAIEQAARQLVLTPDTDRALIAEFVSDVSANGRSKGAGN